MRIFFLRHLKTKGNFEKRYIGRTDESITKIENQNKIIGLPLQPDKIYVSPLKRCIETADLVYPDEIFQVVEDLKEIDFGEFENKNYEELKDNIRYRNFIDGTEEATGGETRTDFKSRCINSFLKITDCDNDDLDIVIVCHGGTIMAIMEEFEENKKDFYSYQIKNGDFFECEYKNKTIYILNK